MIIIIYIYIGIYFSKHVITTIIIIITCAYVQN